ncbi:DUF4153 domain-containing protein [Rubricoccus marinus]|uniref:DUF4153 domain-containing protein n=1 Tax=Rubricoccus marinus TaxID=716817 RepID=A0A259TXH0_9BACT|nr:DUF4153 domain-containing protein [Rubricoccus marinus]OZC02268.1 hypothetical protein BSZ36_04265 [Rubricoccus marinus]
MDPSHLLNYLDAPPTLERLYRDDPHAFARAFSAAWDSHSAEPGLAFWHARLDAEGLLTAQPLAPGAESTWRWAEVLSAERARGLLGWAVGLIVLAVLWFKLPELLGWTSWEGPRSNRMRADHFHQRFAPFYVLFPVLVLLARRYRPSTQSMLTAGSVVAALLAIQAFRPLADLSTEAEGVAWLSVLHLPTLLIAVGSALALGRQWRSVEGRMGYLQLVGEGAALAIPLLIVGALLTGLTAALFEAIDIEAWHVLGEWVVPAGLLGVLPIGLLLAGQRPESARLAPLVARVFGPMALAVLTVYFPFLLLSGELNDRDTLLTLNIALIAVLGLVLLIEAERPDVEKHWTDWVGAGLVTLALAADLTAFAFVAGRLAEGGFTPNRLAVVGFNALIAVHFAGMVLPLWRRLAGNGSAPVEAWTARYLTVYTIWSASVVLLFPFLF